MVKIIVGMMGSSVAKGSSAMATPESVKSFLDIVKSHGVKELDTARVYNAGRSEELLGEVDAGRDFAVSTKAPGFAPGSLKGENILSNSSKSHAALKQDKFDIYYIHGPDRQTPLEEQCAAFGKLYKEGKFERFGVSNLSDAEVQKVYDICKKEGYCLPSIYQGGYSPLHRKAEDTLFPLLQKLNMNFYAFSPLAGGLLAKPVDQILKPAAGTRYADMKVFGDIFLNDTILKALKEQTALGEKHGISIMESTLRWFQHHSPLTKHEGDGVIIGASRNEQIQQTLAACQKGPLPQDVVDGWEQLWVTIKDAAPGYHS